MTQEPIDKIDPDIDPDEGAVLEEAPVAVDYGYVDENP